MIHGFSMFACASLVVTYRDKYDSDAIDFTVFNAGRIADDHPFREEIEQEAATGDSAQFYSEQFFFFFELSNPNYEYQKDAMDFVEMFGGNVIGYSESEGPHGVFFSQFHDSLREDIVARYDSISSH